MHSRFRANASSDNRMDSELLPLPLEQSSEHITGTINIFRTPVICDDNS